MDTNVPPNGASGSTAPGPTGEALTLAGRHMSFDQVKEFVGPSYARYWHQWKRMSVNDARFSWNWAAALGGAWWLGLRKMTKSSFVYATALVLACLVCGLLFGGDPGVLAALVGLAGLGLFLALGAYGDYLYWRHAAGHARVVEDIPDDGAERMRLLDKRGDISWVRCILWGLGTYGIAMLALAAGAGIVAGPGQACRILDIQTEPDVFLVNGELDAGFQVKVTVVNEGRAGDLLVEATLSSSEGSFARQQTLWFDEGQQLPLTYMFHEVTINATNIQSQITCGPA